MDILQYKGHGQICLVKNSIILFEGQFTDCEKALIEGLKFCLSNLIFQIRLEGFSKQLNKKVDTLFGESFSNKFKYAQLKPQEFVDIILNEFNKHSLLNDKLLDLISPFNRIEHDDAVKVKIASICVDQNVKTNSFIFKTDKFNKPDVSFFTDASVSDGSYMAGYGISGKEILVSFRFNEPTQDNNLAELKAIKHAILIAKEMNLSSLEVFTDSSPSIEFLQSTLDSKTIKKEFKKVTDEILEFLDDFDSYQIAWIPRKKNQYADQMSKATFPNSLIF